MLVLFLSRLGSLNALDQTRRNAFWVRWLQAPLPSADSLGRIMDLTEPEDLRRLLQDLYSRLKRNKALCPTGYGLMAAAIDGHESHASYRRCCSGCLQRRVKTKTGWRTQYYHRHVSIMLLGTLFPLLLDVEPVEPGEDELGAAHRLLTRVIDLYPRAFDVVLGDALYADAKIFALLQSKGKDVIAVLKGNQSDLLNEAKILLEEAPASVEEDDIHWRELRDVGGFAWNGSGQVRVVRSREQKQVKRQLDGQPETLLSEWLWVTTCSEGRASSQAIAMLGHARWRIENEGFNELVNRWHADHVYKHSQRAMLTFQLVAMVAYNLFHAFYWRQLRPRSPNCGDLQHVARVTASALYTEPLLATARAP